MSALRSHDPDPVSPDDAPKNDAPPLARGSASRGLGIHLAALQRLSAIHDETAGADPAAWPRDEPADAHSAAPVEAAPETPAPHVPVLGTLPSDAPASDESAPDTARAVPAAPDRSAPARAWGGRASPTAEAGPSWQADVPSSSSPVIRLGAAVLTSFVLLFTLWGALFPLEEAVVVAGRLVPAGLHQKIQHERGGRVARILHRDGERVERGEVVLELDPAADRARLGELNARRTRLTAMRARLDAELGREQVLPGIATVGALRPAIGGPPTGQPAGNAMPTLRWTDAVLSAQDDERTAGRRRLANEIAALEAQLDTLARRREGLSSRREAQADLLDLMRDQRHRLSPLAAKGFVAQARLDDLRRGETETTGLIGSLDAELLEVDSREREVTAQVRRVRNLDRETAAGELSRVLGDLAETERRIEAARTALVNTALRAPVSGTITKLSQHTVGGVIGAGEVVAEIVPADGPLIAEGRVRPADVAGVAVGQDARIVLTALDRSEHDPLLATVSYVAADTTTLDGEEPFYRVRLAIEGERLPALQAGMQAELYVEGESRTFLSYLFEPLTGSLSRAFRE